jgi:hypothetical protein
MQSTRNNIVSDEEEDQEENTRRHFMRREGRISFRPVVHPNLSTMTNMQTRFGVWVALSFWDLLTLVGPFEEPDGLP